MSCFDISVLYFYELMRIPRAREVHFYKEKSENNRPYPSRLLQEITRSGCMPHTTPRPEVLSKLLSKLEMTVLRSCRSFRAH